MPRRHLFEDILHRRREHGVLRPLDDRRQGPVVVEKDRQRQAVHAELVEDVESIGELAAVMHVHCLL